MVILRSLCRSYLYLPLVEDEVRPMSLQFPPFQRVIERAHQVLNVNLFVTCTCHMSMVVCITHLHCQNITHCASFQRSIAYSIELIVSLFRQECRQNYRPKFEHRQSLIFVCTFSYGITFLAIHICVFYRVQSCRILTIFHNIKYHHSSQALNKVSCNLSDKPQRKF